MHTLIIAKIDACGQFGYTKEVRNRLGDNFVNGIDRLEAIYDLHATDPVLGMYGLSLLEPLFNVADAGEFPLLAEDDFDHFVTATAVFWFRRRPLNTLQFVPMSNLRHFSWEYSNEPFEYEHPLVQGISEEVEFVLSRPLGKALETTMDRWIGKSIPVERRLHLWMGMWHHMHAAIMALILHSLAGEEKEVGYIAPYVGMLHRGIPVLAEDQRGVRCLIITRGEEQP